jgi:hypothetical protein
MAAWISGVMHVMPQYIVGLFNAWIAIAAGMLTVFDLALFFLKRNWKWPKSHPFKIALIVLFAAQFGSYYNMATSSTETINDLTNEREQLKIDKDHLEGHVEAQDSQIRDLQAAADELRAKLGEFTKRAANPD